MNQVKKWGAILAAVLLVVVIFQNRAEVKTEILFVDITMPRAVLLFTMAVLGFLAGVLFQRSRAKKAE
tara:strand:+ start:12292 stop:12495 length:204 start_codon:yes stop_codon:yes gene_type:complete